MITELRGHNEKLKTEPTPIMGEKTEEIIRNLKKLKYKTRIKK